MSSSPNRRDRKRIVYFSKRERAFLAIERQREKVKSKARAAVATLVSSADLALSRLFLWVLRCAQRVKAWFWRVFRR